MPFIDLKKALNLSNVNQDIIPSLDNTYWLGSKGAAGLGWAGIKTTRIQATGPDAILISGDDETLRWTIGTGAGAGQYIRPLTNNTGTLGLSTAKTANIFTQALTMSDAGDNINIHTIAMLDTAIMPAAAPAVVGSHMFYFNGATNDFFIFNGIAWVSVRLS